MKIILRIALLCAAAVLVSVAYRAIRAPWVEFRRAEGKFAKGDCASAADIYGKLAQLDFAKRNEVIARLCECRLKTGQEDAAKKLLAGIDPDSKDAPVIWGRLGGLFAQSGLFSDSRDLYLLALKSDPENCQTRFYYARVLVALGEFGGAEKEFRSLLGSCVCVVAGNKSPDGRSKCTEDEMPECEIRLELARVMTYQGRFMEARGEYLKALAQKPDMHAARWELARATFWGGDPKEALRIIEETPQADLSREDASLKADLQMIAKDYAGTEATLKRLLERDSDDDVARMKLAEVLSWARKLKESAGHYEILAKRRPRDVQVRRKYAEVLFWMGRPRQAAAQLKLSLKSVDND